MKVQKPIPRKMQAAARRVPRRVVEEYEEEPNMKLSSAFVVVLLLHVVAVGGIYAFNSIKARRAPVLADTVQTAAKAETGTAPEPVLPASSAAEGGRGTRSGERVYQVQPGDTLEKIASAQGVTVAAIEEANELTNIAMLRIGQALKIPAGAASRPAPRAESPKPAAARKQGGVGDSGETYRVVAGDNPVAIARKFGVKYSDLLELNHIEDPRKLQIGQELRLPARR